MTAAAPQDLPRLFREAFEAGNPDAVADLYEPNGLIAPDPSSPVVGRSAIRAMAAGFMTQHPRFSLHDVEVVQCGDLALVRSRWTITTADPSGGTREMRIQPTLIARRQADAGWLVVIDRPLPLE